MSRAIVTADRTRLIAGPYRTPCCKIGRTLRCAIRGKVIVRGIREAPIQWPYTCNPKGGSPTIIVCGDLARAIHVESETAICHWWGVGTDTVWKWRKALGVKPINKGTSELLGRWSPATVQSKKARSKLKVALKSPERAAKIAAGRRGKPRPPHVAEAVRRANLGRKLSAESRQKMSEAHKRRGTIPPAAGVPWTADEEALLGTMSDAEVAARTGRTLVAVQSRRYVFGVPNVMKRNPISKPPRWTPKRERLLGTMPGTVVARKLRCSPISVFNRRKKLGVLSFRADSQ